MRYLAWFSCGITSAIACKLTIEKYGKANVDLYYIEISSAHPDNERFISDCEKWFGLPIKRVRSKKYQDQFEVIEDTGYVNGANGARCTLELKKNVRIDLQKQLQYPVQIFGFEYSLKEVNRAIRFSEQWPESKPIFPLIEQAVTKQNCAEIILRAGIKLPAMYVLGYNNNNCIGCVKGGKGYWNKIRVDFPAEFNKMAKAEREAGHSCIKESKKIDGLKYSIPIFLDELKPHVGRKINPVVPDCGSICEIKFADILHSKTNAIFNKPSLITQLYLFQL